MLPGLVIVVAAGLASQPTVARFGAEPCANPKKWKECPDAWPAFRAALDSMADPSERKPGGRALRIGPHTYRLSKTLIIDRSLTLLGETGLAHGRSRLLFDPGVGGLIIRGSTPALRDLVIQSSEGRCLSKSEHREGRCRSGSTGVTIEGPARLEGVYVTQFAGHGFHITADKHREAPSNANGWLLVDCQAVKNGGHGLAVEGGDTNAGLSLRFNASNNGGWGIFEHSFLGNTHVACGLASNDTGAVLADKRAARNLFIGCYVESGRIGGRLDVSYPSLWISGWGTPNGDGLFLRDGAFAGGRWRAENARDPKDTVTLALGSTVPRAALELESNADRHPYRLEHGVPSAGWWGLRHAMADGRVPFAFSGAGADEEPGVAWMPNGLLVGQGKSRRRVSVASSPTKPRKGDVVLFEDPAAEGWIGKVCVDPSGSDGKGPKWKRFGRLEE